MYSKGELVETAVMNEGARRPTAKGIGRCIARIRVAYVNFLGVALVVLIVLEVIC
jgi:hypothetical protein